MKRAAFSLLLACGSSEPAAVTVAPVGASSSASPAVIATHDDASLARSNVDHDAVPSSGLHLTLTPSELRVEGEKVTALPFAHDTPNELVIAALGTALEGKHAREAVLSVDPRVAYRPLIEVLYTLGQHDIGTYHFVVSRNGGKQAIGVNAPRVMAEIESTKSNLTVLVARGGISVKTRGGNIAPGCMDTGTGLAVGKKGEQYDFAALAACATRLQGTNQMTDTVMIVTNPDTDFQTVVSTIDAVSASFPRVQFGIPR